MYKNAAKFANRKAIRFSYEAVSKPAKKVKRLVKSKPPKSQDIFCTYARLYDHTWGVCLKAYKVPAGTPIKVRRRDGSVDDAIMGDYLYRRGKYHFFRFSKNILPPFQT